jgi:hypothetical protein
VTIEQQEALEAVCRHHGMPVFLRLIDEIVAKIGSEVMTVPLPTDPEKASLALYAKRMQAEGAAALRNALQSKIQVVKSREEIVNGK